MRQVGILASAGLYALEHNIDRLKEDHAKAAYLAEALSAIPGFRIDLSSVQTNIIIMDVEKTGLNPEEILVRLREKNILLSLGNYMGLRAVTHLDISMEQVKEAAAVIPEVMRKQ